jgi:HlyD family secretion protein
MKRAIPIVIGLAVLGAFAWTLWFLYQKSQEEPVVYETDAPRVMDLVEKTVATGAVVPRREVAIKPRVSGVLKRLHVEPGDHVEAGALIAEIQIIPDMMSLSRAEASREAARISFRNAERELIRQEELFAQSVISESTLEATRLDHDLKKQELEAAEDSVALIREGASARSGHVSNRVHSTVAGMVLDIPVEEGESVIETNTFNEGTTIALIADMSDMIFEGQVDESEVGKLEEGMELAIRVAALDNHRFEGVLEHIAPKGVEQEGAIQFRIRAGIRDAPEVLLRANYSANADIVLDRRDQVLALAERLLQFHEGEPFVEVQTRPQQFERREVEVGLSDGLHIEIVAGLAEDDLVKVPPAPGRGG